jgi:hypothetical protein
MPYIILRGGWCDIVVLNVHAPSADKIDDMKGSFYELERVFYEFCKCHKKLLLGDFSAKLGRNDVFKPTIGNENLHEINNGNGVRVVNFAMSRNLTRRKYNIPTS